MRKLFLTAVLTVTAAAAVCAQDFKTGYFLDNYTYSYRVNPGAPVDGEPYVFFSLGIGNILADAHSNLSLGSFLNSSQTAFLFDSSVSTEEALAGFDRQNALLLNANVNLLTFGRQTESNRFSVELNLRSDSSLKFPYEFIYSGKSALVGFAEDVWIPDYTFSGVNLSANAYTEVALGYTQKIGDLVTVGGRIKGLVGLAGARFVDLASDVALEKLGQPDEYIKGSITGRVDVASPAGFQVGTFSNGTDLLYDMYDVDYVHLLTNVLGGHKSIAGWGAGLDLGATFEPVEGLSLSASLIDLGFITWNRTIGGAFSFNTSYFATGSENNDEIGTRLFAVEVDETAHYTTSLDVTAHVGAKYRMPFYDRLSVGVLGTFRKYLTEVRAGVDVTPADFISLAGSLGFSNYGTDFGLALNFKLPILNFFVGTDALVFPTSRQALFGARFNTLLNAGLVITI